MRDGDSGANTLDLAQRLATANPGFDGLRNLAAGVAHDFNNLLAVILSCTEFAALELASGSAEADALNDARTAAIRAAELCKLILAFAGKRSALSSSVDVAAAVSRAIAAIEVPEKVNIEVLSSVATPRIEGDSALIDQLLRGLIENAVTACSEEGGTVAVALHSGNGALCLDIYDDGVGMDTSTAARAFEPFFTTRFPSRGLGLSAAHGIARSHEGTIELTSELGIGTHVRVSLPEGQRLGRKRPITRPIEGDPNSKRRVLAVDDEPLVARAIERVLDAGGYVVRVVHSGGEALARFEANPESYDLVILDMTMPGLDGPETFQQLRAIRPDLRVLLSSGYHHLESTEALVATGHCWFLAKPYEPEQLLSIVSDILAQAPAPSPR